MFKLVTQLIFLIACYLFAEKSKFNSNVERPYKFTQDWECLHKDDEIFTVALKA